MLAVERALRSAVGILVRQVSGSQEPGQNARTPAHASSQGKPPASTAPPCSASRPCRFGFVYLDASCLLYGRRRGPAAPLERLDVVDFCHTRSLEGNGEAEGQGSGHSAGHMLERC